MAGSINVERRRASFFLLTVSCRKAFRVSGDSLTREEEDDVAEGLVEGPGWEGRGRGVVGRDGGAGEREEEGDRADSGLKPM